MQVVMTGRRWTIVLMVMVVVKMSRRIRVSPYSGHFILITILIGGHHTIVMVVSIERVVMRMKRRVFGLAIRIMFGKKTFRIQSGTHLYVEMEGREGLGCAQLSITQVEDCYKYSTNQNYKYN